ncbi:hypothetical protein [Nostoc sp.]
MGISSLKFYNQLHGLHSRKFIAIAIFTTSDGERSLANTSVF